MDQPDRGEANNVDLEQLHAELDRLLTDAARVAERSGDPAEDAMASSSGHDIPDADLDDAIQAAGERQQAMLDADPDYLDRLLAQFGADEAARCSTCGGSEDRVDPDCCECFRCVSCARRAPFARGPRPLGAIIPPPGWHGHERCERCAPASTSAADEQPA